jgi:hypothetical protein
MGRACRLLADGAQFSLVSGPDAGKPLKSSGRAIYPPFIVRRQNARVADTTLLPRVRNPFAGHQV